MVHLYALFLLCHARAYGKSSGFYTNDEEL